MADGAILTPGACHALHSRSVSASWRFDCRARAVSDASYDRPNARSQLETAITETAFRTFGGLLGLVGVLLVAYELDAAIGQYSPCTPRCGERPGTFTVSGAGSRRRTAAW